MTLIKYDFHIHTKYLGCANATMEIPAIVQECRRLGVRGLGISDHLDSLDKLELHVPIRRDPLVDVLVHPYWFHKGEFDRGGWPWFNSMKLAPERYVRELGQTARQTGTAIEINGQSILHHPNYGPEFQKEYFNFLAILAEEGVTFSVGSDAHDLAQLATVQDAWRIVERLQVPPERVWRPQGQPLVGGKINS